MIKIATGCAALLLAACSAQPQSGADGAADRAAAAGSGAPAQASAITLTAADGTRVFGDYYAAQDPKATILLFHQAGSSAAEYATIAPRLVDMGYSALAIDQRSGGDMYGPNRTVRARGASGDYLAAKRDLQAALDWAGQRKAPVILWGSSYSAALVFLLAAENPGKAKALLAFSPGEYLDDDHAVRRAAAKLDIPVFIDASNPEEAKAASEIAAALGHHATTLFVPDHGLHGSSTLIAARNGAGAAANWAAVTKFLGGLELR